MAENGRARVILSGRVQGVAFRFFAEKWAASLGLTGWVRNLYDGRVEVLAEGDRTAIDLFIEKLKIGPRMAVVEDVEVSREDYTGEFPDFSVKFFGG